MISTKFSTSKNKKYGKISSYPHFYPQVVDKVINNIHNSTISSIKMWIKNFFKLKIVNYGG